jgi:hypothetical protein
MTFGQWFGACFRCHTCPDEPAQPWYVRWFRSRECFACERQRITGKRGFV